MAKLEIRSGRARGAESVSTALCTLAEAHGTDKLHHYTCLYDLFLRDRRERIKTVLEIGILHGASLRMWRDYLPGARVCGIDAKLIEIHGLETFQLDQGDSELLKQVGEQLAPIDLIVDDGSHKPEHQAMAVNVLMPFLSEDGLYVVEDVNPPKEELTARIPYEFSYFEHHHVEGMAGRGLVLRAGARYRCLKPAS